MAKNDRILLDGIIDDRIIIGLPSAKRDEVFEYFAFEQILKDYDLSKDEILDGSIDGRQDGGIDGFFILVNGHYLQDPESFMWPRIGSDLKVFIITCKHHDTFKEASLDKLVASLSEIFDFGIEDHQLKAAYSESLLRMRNNLRYAYRKLSPRLSSFSVSIYYASRGDTSALGQEVKARANQLETLVKECFGTCHSKFLFFGSTELVELNRQMPNYTLELPFLDSLAKGERYVVLVRLVDYFKFVSDDGKLRRYLFDSNVRDFMGLNRVNEDIKATLEHADSPDFWWLNNGVTILASSANITGKSIQANDVQIVNGLQTTESIYRHFVNGGLISDERCVLVKVIVTTDEEVRDSIIRATNNQTNVEMISLHATEKIQRDIEEVLLRHGLYYERRQNYYVNQAHSQSEIVTPLYIAAGYTALILKLPHTASFYRARYLRSSDVYNSVFSPKTPIEIWPKIAGMLKRVDEELEKLRPTRKSTDKFLKGWRYIIALLLVAKELGKYDFTSSELASFDVTKVTAGRIEEIWNELQGYSKSSAQDFNRWTSITQIINVCRLFGESHNISGIEMLESRQVQGKQFSRKRLKADTSVEITQEFIDKVRAELPAQPWKPGIGKVVISNIGCRPREYYAAVKKLIADGVFYNQKDGVLFDLDGKVVGLDAERVEGETLSLIENEEVQSDGQLS
jgi:hypothetical protein